jgi:hypothetical protein
MKKDAKKSGTENGKGKQPATKKKTVAKAAKREGEMEKLKKRAALTLMSEEERLAATGEQVMEIRDGDPPSKTPVRVTPAPRQKIPRNSASDLINSPGYQSLIEQLARDGLPQDLRETMKAAYGFDDWRLSVLLVANGKGGELERAELAQWLMSKVTELDGDELRAFAKCMDAIKDNATVNRAKALALHFVFENRRRFGRTPTKAEVKRYLVRGGLQQFAKKGEGNKNESRVFKGPILSLLPSAKAGRPKKPKSKK